MNQIIKKAILLALVCLFLPLSAFSQVPNKNMEISINPLVLLMGQLPVAYRIGISDKVALSVHGRGMFFSLSKTKITGFGLDVGPKFFLSGEIFKNSWYVEPSFGLSYVYVGNSNGESYRWKVGPSFVGGYGWVWDSGLSVNAGLGLTYSFILGSTEFLGDFGVTGLAPTGEVSIGWVF